MFSLLLGAEDPFTSLLAYLTLELFQVRHSDYRKILMEEVGVLWEEGSSLLEV